MSDIPYDIAKLITLRCTRPEMLSSIDPVLLVLIDGVCCKESPFYLLRPLPHVIQMIWYMIVQWYVGGIKKGVSRSPPHDIAFLQLNSVSSETITFPKPKNIYITMMPFVMARSFEGCKLPKSLKPYWVNIIDQFYSSGFGRYQQKLIPKSELGKVGYLTIHESYVEENKTQHKSMLHTSCPGDLIIATNRRNEYVCVKEIRESKGAESYEILEGKFGSGECVENSPINIRYNRFDPGPNIVGGIYIASNVIDSCEVYNYRIVKRENGEEIINEFGDVEHLCSFLPEHKTMDMNTMYWITHRTPLRSLPLKSGAFRQYFKLYTSDVSVWFEEFSTKNPFGVLPDPAITRIVKGSKAEEKKWALFLGHIVPEEEQVKKSRRELKEERKSSKNSGHTSKTSMNPRQNGMMKKR